jgi:hypothetical protein
MMKTVSETASKTVWKRRGNKMRNIPFCNCKRLGKRLEKRLGNGMANKTGVFCKYAIFVTLNGERNGEENGEKTAT